MKKILLTICAIMISFLSYSQVGISETSITADASSILELKSTTKGFLIPRMTTSERDLISSPAEGLLIFNTTTKKYNYYETTWKVMLSNVVDLTTDVTGTLPVSNGGTGSSSQSAKSFTYTDASGNIVSTSTPTNGQLLVGSTGNIPVVANITAGSGIAVTNGLGSIKIDNVIPVTTAAATAGTTTTSATDVLITNVILTPGAGDYFAIFSGSFANSSNSNTLIYASIYVNGVKVTNSERQQNVTKNVYSNMMTTANITGLLASQTIEVRWRVPSPTGTIQQGTLNLIKIK